MRATAEQQQATVAEQHFERWRRKHGGRGSRIPEGLWNEAVGLARTAGLYRAAKALRLDYNRLKGRMSRSGGLEARRGSPSGAQSAFVELPMGSLGGARAVVELVGGGGEQMRFHLTGASTAELMGLAQAFWSRRS